jgi:hypothetical protein
MGAATMNGGRDDENRDDIHLTDEEIDKALSAFEAEAASDPLSSFDEIVAGETSNFDDELEGLLGNKAKVALILSSLASAELLAAFCYLAEISVLCVGSKKGAVGILKDLEGDGPEQAVKKLTQTISGFSVALAVNRASKLQVHMWVDGAAGDEIAPPLVLSASADFVEDLLIGASDVDEFSKSKKVIDSAALSRDDAFKIIAKFTKHPW